MREYAPLFLAPLAPGAQIAHPNAPGRVTLDDPAFSVMTDLREVSAATTAPEEPIDSAHAVMIRRGVRLLFVLDGHASVVGILTTPAARLDAATLLDVAQMRVGHVVATLKAVRRQHLTVAEDGGTRVRGLF